MNILIACECSGIVRDAFIARGHTALSCDLLPSERPGPHHLGDVLPLITGRAWDMILAFPPCTHLASSGARWFAEKQADGRQQAAIAFFLALANAPCPRICIENPVGIMSRLYRKPDQIIQPYQFGHDASKSTCLWLVGLPLLTSTRYIESHNGVWANQTPSGQNRLGPSPDRARIRSRTYQGIADAMAAQWSPL